MERGTSLYKYPAEIKDAWPAQGRYSARNNAGDRSGCRGLRKRPAGKTDVADNAGTGYNWAFRLPGWKRVLHLDFLGKEWVRRSPRTGSLWPT